MENLTEANAPYFKRGAKLTDHKVGTKERYIKEVGYYIGQVQNQIERVDQAGILINSYPKIKAWRDSYGRFEYFQYHMEQYYIGVSGIMDRLLLLVNQVYELGFKDRGTRYSHITERLAERGVPDMESALVQLCNALKGIKQSKNSYTHLVRFWERELWNIGVFEYVLKHKPNMDPNGFFKQDLMFDVRMYRKAKLKLILENEKELIKMIEGIYEILNKEYLDRLKKF